MFRFSLVRRGTDILSWLCVWCVLGYVTTGSTVWAQQPATKSFGQATATVSTKTCQAVEAANAAAWREFHELESNWRQVFRDARRPERLKVFVNDSIDLFEKARQVHDFAANPAATDARLREMFRNRVLNEEAICRSMEASLQSYLKRLDEQDQTLCIQLKIDRAVGQTQLSRSVIDPASIRKPLAAVTASATKAAQDDFQRTVVTFIASEAIGAGIKSAARESGLNRSEPGSVEDFLGGLLIDIAVGVAVDAATDPTPQMVSNLEKQLQSAERAILDQQGATPGFLATIKRLTQERVQARERIITTK